jgi:hypothetical protein
MATSDTNVKLSNVIGAPFSDYVLLQLYQRAAHNSTLNRSNEDILFLANKTSWARLVSSVNISNDDLGLVYRDLGVNYSTPDGLAKNWILEAGTSKQKGNGIELRTGIGPDGAYGLGGTEELGYRPMPGLTSVQIETTGRLGSLRQATIQFKVWNMNQLDVVEALYFRLGYSMLLEWGHTQYLENTGGLQRNVYGIDDPFKPQKRKEQIQQAIALKARNSFGNYDGMLGVVSNFTWAMNQDAGYDCTVKLVGLGAVMDSMRINQAYTLPEGSLKQYLKNKDVLARIQETLIAQQKQIEFLKANPVTKATGSITLDPLPKSPEQLQALAVKYDTYPATNDFNAFLRDYGIAVYKDKSQFQYFTVASTVKPANYSYYVAFNKNKDPDAATQIAAKYEGLYLNVPGIGFRGFKNITKFKFDTALLNNAIANSLTVQNTQSPDVQRDINTQNTRLGQQGFSSNIANYFSLKTSTIEASTAAGAFLAASSPVVGDFLGFFGVGKENVDIALSDPLPQGKATVIYAFSVAGKPQGGLNSFTTIEASYNEVSFRPTRTQVLNELQTWINSGGELSNVTSTKGNGKEFKISGTFTSTVTATYNGGDSNKATATAVNPGSNGDKSLKDVPITFKVTTDNPGFLKEVTAGEAIGEPIKTPAESANTGDAGGIVNKASTEQQDVANGFASALQAMLITIQASAQVARSTSGKPFQPVDIRVATSKFFQEGIMNGILDEKGITKKIINPSTSEFNLVQYAAKGFNSQLMIDPTLYNSILSVQFDKLCKAFIVAYNQGGTDAEATKLRAPVYISFGYLLAFLNNMCLIYDSPESKIPTNNNPDTGTPKRPYVYIDFNPETNFCLTSPQQLSVDPTVCLIDVSSTLDQYKAILPEDIAKSWSIKNDGPLFDPASGVNLISAELQDMGFAFKGDNLYQGKIMNVMLNIDYLLGLIASSTGSDPEHAVKLEPFLQTILRDINKALGNTNSFRVAYRDDSNTIQIQDDQWVPSLVEESNILQASVYNSKLTEGNQAKLSGLIPISSDPKELPVAGQLSLARQFQLRSGMSTKMASMIAISAQAATGSVNATDHSSLSYLNSNFEDRYKPYIQDATNGKAGSNVNTKNNDPSNDRKAAQMFNNHINSIYSNLLLSPEVIDLAKNYYIERMSKVKSGDPIVTAAPFIPAELEMTLDGVSGIIMGNAFTIPQNRLPLSLRGKNGLAKIAFIVTGLTHTIQSNEWLTKIKGQMIKLREKTEIPKAAEIIGKLISYTTVPLGSGGGGNLRGSALYNDQAFRAKLKTITDKYDISDEDLLKVMNSESGLNPAKSLYLYYPEKDRATYRALNQPAEGYRLFATGLIQFTRITETSLGKTLEEIQAMSAIDQLDVVDKFLSSYKRDIKGGSIYVLYGAIFYPAALSAIKANNDDYIIGSDRSTSYALAVSRDNPSIAKESKKKPGVDTITIGDFKRFVKSKL